MISAILLAAGKSRRMNGENKLLKKFNNKYLINHILGTLIKSNLSKIIVILGFQSNNVKKITIKSKKIIFIKNKNFESGIASSIKMGLKKIPKRNIGFLILQADMPLISKEIINSIYYEMLRNKKEIFAPVYKKRIGNPVGFKKSMIKFINKIKKDSGAKKIIKKSKKKLFLVKVNSKSIFRDFNYKEDFSNN